MVRKILCALALAGVASPLAATPLNVRVVDASGRPVDRLPRSIAIALEAAGADPAAIAAFLPERDQSCTIGFAVSKAVCGPSGPAGQSLDPVPGT